MLVLSPEAIRRIHGASKPHLYLGAVAASHPANIHGLLSTTESWATRGSPRWTNLRLCSLSVSQGPPVLSSETKKSWAPDTPALLGEVSRPVHAAVMDQRLKSGVHPP